MANTKYMLYTHCVSDLAVGMFCQVERLADWYLLDSTDGAFKASPTDPDLVVTEYRAYNYRASSSDTVWTDGMYLVTFTLSDVPVAATQAEIHSDDWIVGVSPSDVWNYGTRTLTAISTDIIDLSNLDVPVSTRTSSGVWTNEKAGFIDAAVSSRATSDEIAEITETLTRYSGTLTASAAEQAIKEITPSTQLVIYRGTVDLTNMVSGDTIVITEYYKVKTSGDYLKHDSRSFSGSQSTYPAMDLTPRMPNLYGFKLTLTQTASGVGGFKDFDWEIFLYE